LLQDAMAAPPKHRRSGRTPRPDLYPVAYTSTEAEARELTHWLCRAGIAATVEPGTSGVGLFMGARARASATVGHRQRNPSPGRSHHRVRLGRRPRDSGIGARAVAAGTGNGRVAIRGRSGTLRATASHGSAGPRFPSGGGRNGSPATGSRTYRSAVLDPTTHTFPADPRGSRIPQAEPVALRRH